MTTITNIWSLKIIELKPSSLDDGEAFIPGEYRMKKGQNDIVMPVAGKATRQN